MVEGLRLAPTLGDALRARKTIAGIASRTPLIASDDLGRRLGRPVHLKLEVLQPTHSFKVRGAANRILALSDQERRRGVVTASTGNHGRALAHVARRLGIPAVVFVSSLVGENKLTEIRNLGAEVRIEGAGQDEASVAAQSLAAERSMTLVSPFDDPDAIFLSGTGDDGVPPLRFHHSRARAPHADHLIDRLCACLGRRHCHRDRQALVAPASKRHPRCRLL